ncbi:MAG TPA: VWA domain-containing protein [Polyangiaceae bacterium]|jgi:hypothetical protein
MRAWLILPSIAFIAACSSSAETGDFAGPSGGGGVATGGGDASVPSGVLTAGAWDDNRNYDFFSTYLGTAASVDGAPPIAQADRDAAHALFAGDRASKTRLDIAIVIDTTGSMGDEAAYLKSEFQNISTAIGSDFPNADPQWALVAYRDRPDTDPGDDYVTRTSDFTGDAGSFQGSLGSLSAGGGGDYQEAPELGLAAMNQLAWRADADVARVAFWIGDAPQHSEHAADIAQTFQDARQRDIHLYPVAASGADATLELTMRSAAQLTGGRYLFLTDDSGIGDSHEVPSIPCFFVTKLAKQIVRMASIELTGVYREPDAGDIIRTGGNPASGACTLEEGGGVVSAF